MRAVLDVNVVISALLSPTGTPARVLIAWQEGHFDLIVSPLLLAELRRTLEYPKLRRHISPEEAERVVEWLRRWAIVADDPAEGSPPLRGPDPGDDYLLALAASEQAVLVTGDDHLLSVASDLPIHAPADFLRLLRL